MEENKMPVADNEERKVNVSPLLAELMANKPEDDRIELPKSEEVTPVLTEEKTPELNVYEEEKNEVEVTPVLSEESEPELTVVNEEAVANPEPAAINETHEEIGQAFVSAPTYEEVSESSETKVPVEDNFQTFEEPKQGISEPKVSVENVITPPVMESPVENNFRAFDEPKQETSEPEVSVENVIAPPVMESPVENNFQAFDEPKQEAVEVNVPEEKVENPAISEPTKEVKNAENDVPKISKKAQIIGTTVVLVITALIAFWLVKNFFLLK